MLSTDHWHLSAERVKKKRQHDVFIPKKAQEIVYRDDRIANEQGLIFTTNGVSFRSFDKPNKRLRATMNALAGMNLPHFTQHDLRRTCETGLAMLGTSQSIIDRVTNHVSGLGMAHVYNMYDYSPEKEAALQKWADHVEALVV